MKKIAVLSDTHKNIKVCEKLKGILNESDYVFHLGDFSSDLNGFGLGEKLHKVNGNCDILSSGENERTLEIEGVKIFMCHGHKYGVKGGYEQLEAKAEKEKAALCLFGHTHNPIIYKKGKTLFVNPGCTTLSSTEKSYAYILIYDGAVTAKIVLLKN